MAITISVTSGTGYFGSTYTQVGAAAAGQWYADETAIPGATASTYVLASQYEGKGITFRTTSPAEISNKIKLFMPHQLSGLVAHFDVSRSDLLTLSGSAVVSIASRVGGWTAGQASAGVRPNYAATGRNSRPVIYGDGSSQFLDINDTGNLPTHVPAHMLAVAHLDGGTATFKMLIKWGSVSAARRGIAKSNTGRVAMIGGSGTTNLISTDPWSTEDKIVSANFLNPGAELIVNGQISISTANVYSEPDTGAKYIFRDATLYWNGGFQDIPIFDRSLSVAERQKVEGYFASKWGLRGLLDAGHPYKSTNPPVDGFAGSGILGAVVSVGVLDTPIPAEVNAVLGAPVGVGAFSLVKFATISGELGLITAQAEATAYKKITGVALLGSLVGESVIDSEESITLDAVLGMLVGEGAFRVESVVEVGAILGELFVEGEIVVPSPPFAEIILDGLVGSGVIEAYEPGVIDITLGEIVGESTLTAPDYIVIGEALLDGLVGEIPITAIRTTWMIVEDGTIVNGANSYDTLAYVDNYMQLLNMTEWRTASKAEREGAIIRATSGIDAIYGKRYPGTKVMPRVQALQWPRKDAKDAKDQVIAETEIPIEIKKAVAEGAYLELTQPGYLMPNWTPDQLVLSETLGPLSVTYSDPAKFGKGGNAPSLSKIDGILAPLLGAKPNLSFGQTVRV